MFQIGLYLFPGEICRFLQVVKNIRYICVRNVIKILILESNFKYMTPIIHMTVIKAAFTIIDQHTIFWVKNSLICDLGSQKDRMFSNTQGTADSFWFIYLFIYLIYKLVNWSDGCLVGHFCITYLINIRTTSPYWVSILESLDL